MVSIVIVLELNKRMMMYVSRVKPYGLSFISNDYDLICYGSNDLGI